jgi:S-formylglutathione hydrolase FrmB
VKLEPISVKSIHRRAVFLGVLLLLVTSPMCLATAPLPTHHVDICKLNRELHGQVVDYTKHGGADRRIWSNALGQCRDMYVYLPPGYDPARQYPLVIWLHGFMQDEESFVKHVVRDLDDVMACGELPPAIVVAPDGSIYGKATYFSAGSFFINSRAGNFEDYIIQDVWPFMTAHYPIRPEREAHAIVGVSMGGFAAYNLGFKYSSIFKVVAGIFPPLNLRWVDCHCRYMANFDPCCWGWRTQVHGREVVGRYYHGLVTIHMKRIIDPLFGRGPDAIEALIRENPIEMIDRYGIQEGTLEMFIAYAGKDEFNIDAQVESFLYVARQRGLTVDVAYDPKGRHNIATAKRLFPDTVAWLAPRLAPYSPGLAGGPVARRNGTATRRDPNQTFRSTIQGLFPLETLP